MKNNKKSFYMALYSCIGVMLLIAVIVSVNNYNELEQNQNLTAQNAENVQNAENAQNFEPVNRSGDQSYLAAAEATTQANEAALEPAPEPTTAPSAAAPAKKAEAKTTEPESQAKASDEKVFSLFDDTKEMSWPVNGKIVMDYSVETAVYDKTLEQYRTNDSICIAAPVGTEVKAAAEGIVDAVFSDSENGKSIVLNHGNGWLSTYSQLQDSVLVNEGQVVAEGEIIGAIGEPSNYSILLGSHLDFKVTKNDTSTDPKLILSQYDE